EGISILVKCEEAAVLLEQKIMDFRHETEVQVLLKELVLIKARISKLLQQASQGLTTIQDAKVELSRQTKEVEEQKEKVTKLDQWLESINNELKESTKQSDVLTEQDIIRYIEIYERYLREYDEYEIIIKSVILTIRDDSSQLREKLSMTSKTLEQTRNLVITEIERLRHILIHLRTVPEAEAPIEEDISQTDRTIDSTSMPEEIVSPREPEIVKYEEPFVEKVLLQKSAHASDQETEQSQMKLPIKETEPSQINLKIEETTIPEHKEKVTNMTIETQTGKSLMSDAPSLVDKSIICKPEHNDMVDVSVTCAPPQEVEVQTSEQKSLDKEILENIQVKQFISDGHETIEIASRPVTRDLIGEQSLFVDAHYKDDNMHKDTELNITHSLPQSFETIMVEPDETTTEVVVDADGTKRIIVKKVRRTLVTRQKVLQTHEHHSQILSSANVPQEQSLAQLTLHGDQGSSSTVLDDGGMKHIQYQTYGGQLVSELPGSEVSIQEITSRPDMIITMEHGMKPEEILQLAEGEIPPLIQTSSSSVTAVVQQVTKRIIKTRRRIIRRVVIIDGKEHVMEEVIEEPDNVEVLEEQIPRISISVKDGALTSEVNDDADNKGQPGKNLQDQGKEKKSHDGDEHDKSDNSPHFQKPESMILDEKKQTLEPTSRITEDKYQANQFLIEESNNDSAYQIKPSLETMTIRESFAAQPVGLEQMNSQTFNVREPRSDEPSKFATQIMSNMETSSSVATVVQNVTHKLTRKRKRIIKHITIIDGQEHVTEEVIEEPDEVEIVEDEPQISHFVQNQGTKARRIKIKRQVEMIDGKEHITEQMMEESDDEPDVEFVADKSNIQFDRPYITEVEEQDTYTKPLDESENISKPFIKSGTCKPVTKVTRIRKRVIRHTKVIDGKEHVTEEVIEEPDEVEIIEDSSNLPHIIQEEGIKTKRIKIIRQVNIIDGKEHITEQILDDAEDEYMPDSTITAEINIGLNKPSHSDNLKNQQSLSGDEATIKIKDQHDVIDYTKNLIDSEIDHTKMLHPVSSTEAKTLISQRSVEDRQCLELSRTDIKISDIANLPGKVPEQKAEIEIVVRPETDVADNLSKQTSGISSGTGFIEGTIPSEKLQTPRQVADSIVLEESKVGFPVHIKEPLVKEQKIIEFNIDEPSTKHREQDNVTSIQNILIEEHVKEPSYQTIEGSGTTCKPESIIESKYPTELEDFKKHDIIQKDSSSSHTKVEKLTDMTEIDKSQSDTSDIKDTAGLEKEVEIPSFKNIDAKLIDRSILVETKNLIGKESESKTVIQTLKSREFEFPGEEIDKTEKNIELKNQSDDNLTKIKKLSDKSVPISQSLIESEIDHSIAFMPIDVLEIKKATIPPATRDEPDVNIDVFDNEPSKVITIQQEGVKTKRIRIVKSIQIIDGKEQVTEQIFDE
ncbi:jg4462, partial [Pararge aegeria aegeria]